ncbi:hypothetical protein L1887_40778 [Cichorium endivia]|nr:hypothetical protein L1887_40778 [Cichorium endivia]
MGQGTGPSGSGSSGSSGSGSGSSGLVDKCKGVLIEQSKEQRLKQREEEYTKILVINSIARGRKDTTQLLNIKYHDDQLEIPYNPKIFYYFEFVKSIRENNIEAFKQRKIRFHTHLTQEPKVVWSSKWIVNIISMNEGVLFENTFQDIEYFVLRGSDNIESRLTVANFLIMNPHDFIQMMELLKFPPPGLAPSISIFTKAKDYIVGFFDYYLKRIGEYDIDIAKLFGNTLAAPICVVKILGDYEDG